MALSDCSHCWETPCKCGYEYSDWSEDELVEFITNILKYHNKEEILKRISKQI